VDKGLTHFIRSFRNDQEVIASIQVEQGRHGEYGWGVYFEQGRHRCVLTGTVSGRPREKAEEDAIWTACAEWARFDPIPWQGKVHQENLWIPDSVTGAFLEWDNLGDLSSTGMYQQATQSQKEQMDRFSEGIRKFTQVFTCNPFSDGVSQRVAGYAQQAAASRRFRVSDGPEL
jgi:hypothetical protein